MIDPAPDSSALLAARRSEKIRADKKEEKRRLEYGWPEEEERANARQGKVKDKMRGGVGREVGHVNFWAGLEKVRGVFGFLVLLPQGALCGHGLLGLK